MNKSTLIIASLLSVLLLNSCLSSDDSEVVYSNDAAISSFTLGTLKRIATTKSKLGLDSTYQTTYSGSSVKFYIDQLRHEVYNPDSLPKGVDQKKIICTITTKNGGVITIKSMTSDTLGYYSSSDSIDFTEPRTFRIYSSAGTAYNDYKISVNVHKQDSGTFVWKKMAEALPFKDATAVKLATLGTTLLAFASDGSQTKVWQTTDGTAWTQTGTTLAADGWQNVVGTGAKVYYLNNGNIYTLTAQGQTSAAARGISHLVAASHSGAYGLKSDGKGISRFDGKNWADETLDGDASALPTGLTAFSAQRLVSNDSTDVVMFIGLNGKTKAMETWEKIDEYQSSARNHSWLHITPPDGYALPVITQPNIIDYDGYSLAFGPDDFVNHSLFTPFYQTADKGLTWHKFSGFELPGGAEFNGVCSSTVDSNNFIWLFCGGTGQLWRGRINKLGWVVK